jgi:ABC-type cobalamin/Fe3+-siderophores transport system ATPase subunit
VLLAGGRVTATGPPAGVLREDLLAQYFGTGVQVLTGEDGELAVISRRLARRRPGAARGQASPASGRASQAR